MSGSQKNISSERQVRPLTRLEPEQQREAWTKGEITIRLENLRLIDYSTADCEAIAKLRDRLHKLYLQELEDTAVALVDLFGKLDRPYLTALEENLLVLLETE